MFLQDGRGLGPRNRSRSLEQRFPWGAVTPFGTLFRCGFWSRRCPTARSGAVFTPFRKGGQNAPMNANVSKTNGVKLIALVAVLAMVVVALAAVMPSEQTDAASSKDTLYISGTIDEDTPYNGNTVVVVDDLTVKGPEGIITIGADTTFIINEGVTVTIQDGGQFIVNNGAKEVTVNGNLVATGKDSIIAVASGFKNTDHTGGITVTSTGSITAEKGAWIASQTFESKETDLGSIVLKSGATLSITKNSGNIAAIRSIEVVMYDGSTFSTEGYFKNVVVRAMGDATYFTAGAAYITNLGETPDFRNIDNKDTSDLTFTVTTQTATAYYKNGAMTEAEKATIRQYVLNVDGTITGYTDGKNSTTLYQDYLVIANAKIATAMDTTGEYSFIKQDKAYTQQFYYAAEEIPADDTNGKQALKAQTSVTGTLDVTEKGKITLGSASYVTVSGTLSVDYDDDAAENFKGVDNTQLNGYLYITGTVSMYVDNFDDTSGLKLSTYYIDGGSMEIIGGDISSLSGKPTTGDNAGQTITRSVYGAAYVDDSTKTDILYICDLSVAVTEAAAIGADVTVYGLNTSLTATIEDLEDAQAAGAYVISADIAFPDKMEVTFVNTTYITEDATVTFESGADANDGTGKIIVDGKLVDRNNTFDYTGVESFVIFEVKKTNADETETTYTTMAIALGEAQPGETVNLNGVVNITENTTIPADVTVVVDDGLNVKGATLTVNGVLDMKSQTLTVTDNDEDTNNVIKVAVVVNNYIANADNVAGIPGAYFNGQIREDDSETTDYVASPAVAGQYCTSDVTIYGKISAGAVTFTQDDADMTITIVGEVTGDITMVGNEIEFVLADAVLDTDNETVKVPAGKFTGTVTSAVTSGTSTINFNKAGGATVYIDSADDGETVTTAMVLDGTITGSATISAGAVQVGKDLKTPDYGEKDKVRNTLTVASGATLDIVKGSKLTVQAGTETVNGKEENYATLVVDGTLAYADGSITNTNGIIAINGTMTVAKSTSVIGTVNVAGSLTVAADETLNVTKMYVGSAAESLGVGGSIAGDIKTTAFIVAYAGADVSGATINDNNGETDAEVTAYYINGTLYMTSYAVSNQPLKDIIPKTVELTGYEPVVYDKDASGKSVSNWYTDEAMKTPLNYSDSATVADVTALYAKAEVSQALVYVSVGSNMTVYIDDVRYGNGSILLLDVGQHTITVQVNAGYTGETSVLVGGTAVTGGTFEITPEMAESNPFTSNATSSDCVILSVTGNIAIDSGATGGDDGMGLTEILLIILVVLIVVMAIMVALRLMRS